MFISYLYTLTGQDVLLYSISELSQFIEDTRNLKTGKSSYSEDFLRPLLSDPSALGVGKFSRYSYSNPSTLILYRCSECGYEVAEYPSRVVLPWRCSRCHRAPSYSFHPDLSYKELPGLKMLTSQRFQFQCLECGSLVQQSVRVYSKGQNPHHLCRSCRLFYPDSLDKIKGEFGSLFVKIGSVEDIHKEGLAVLADTSRRSVSPRVIFFRCKSCGEIHYVRVRDYQKVRDSRSGGFTFLCDCCKSLDNLKRLSSYVWRSKREVWTEKWWRDRGYSVEANTRALFSIPREIDLYIPSFKVAFEFNGCYWHSQEMHGSAYHKEKRDLCQAVGIKLYHIWEDVSDEFIVSLFRWLLGENGDPRVKVSGRNSADLFPEEPAVLPPELVEHNGYLCWDSGGF